MFVVDVFSYFCQCLSLSTRAVYIIRYTFQKRPRRGVISWAGSYNSTSGPSKPIFYECAMSIYRATTTCITCSCPLEYFLWELPENLSNFPIEHFWTCKIHFGLNVLGYFGFTYPLFSKNNLCMASKRGHLRLAGKEKVI